MKSFGSYISKYLVSFVAFILILLFLNAVVFGLTFQKIVTEDYGDSSPQAMLEMTATAATPEQLSDEAVQMLRQNHIWAIYLNTDGQCYWSVDLPDNVPKNYTIQDVALFSKGYIEDYPVFIWNTDDGLLVLGYPTDSYTKLTSNYYSIAALQRLPIFVLGMLGLDLLCLFSAYYFSKRRMVRLSKLLRSYVADLLNTGISDSYNIGIKITPDAENAVLECDARLISRAVNNLVQNSMKHNPQGCEVCLSLTASQNHLILAVTDNGTGLSAEKLQELEEKPHYMESTDERLDLRHGLGLLIVQQVAIAHNGTFKLTNVFPKGCEATLIFPYIG